MEWQTVQTLISLFQELSDFDLHCLFAQAYLPKNLGKKCDTHLVTNIYFLISELVAKYSQLNFTDDKKSKKEK